MTNPSGLQLQTSYSVGFWKGQKLVGGSQSYRNHKRGYFYWTTV